MCSSDLAETPIFLQLCLHNASLIGVEPHHMQAEKAWPTPWTQCPRPQLAACPSLSIILTCITGVPLCLLGALFVMRKLLVIFEAAVHALPMSREFFVALRGFILAALGQGTILTMVRTVFIDPRCQLLLMWRNAVGARCAAPKLFARPLRPACWVSKICTWCAAGTAPGIAAVFLKARMRRILTASTVCATLIGCCADLIHPTGSFGRLCFTRSLATKLFAIPWSDVDVCGIWTITTRWLATRPGAVLLETGVAAIFAAT